jgi:16S rRNA (guanine527-N7)-methyltransferase
MSTEPAALLSPAAHASLVEVLLEARHQGHLGPGAVDTHISHALSMGQATRPPTGLVIDLGSGGGVPGLPLALAWPDSRWVLLDSSARRAAFLHQAVERLGLADRVEVRCQRAEEAGRTDLRGSAHRVVARSFAGPAVTAECAAPLLRVEGELVVAEPPGGAPERWPEEQLGRLGLRPVAALTEPVALQVLRQIRPCPTQYPRRVGVPAKRPLF